MNDPKSLGTYNSNAPVAPGSNVASVVMPESNVWYPPLTNVVNVFVSPLQFFLKTKSTLTKSDLLPPIFFISPLKTILPCASFFSVILPTRTQFGDYFLWLDLSADVLFC